MRILATLIWILPLVALVLCVAMVLLGQADVLKRYGYWADTGNIWI